MRRFLYLIMLKKAQPMKGWIVQAALAIGIIGAVHAQGWHRVFGSTSYNALRGAGLEWDGNTLIIGGRWDWLPSGLGSCNFSLIKADSAGGQGLWGRGYGGNSCDEPHELIVIPGQKYVLVGATNSYGAGDYDAFVVVLDTQGNLLWSKTYGGNKEDRFLGGIRPSIGGYIFVGYTMSYSTGEDVYVVRTNENGDTLWVRTYGHDIGNDRGVEIIEINPNRYLIVGYTTSWGQGYEDMLAIMIDSIGQEIWMYAYGTSGGEYATDAIQISPTTVLIYGSGWGGGTAGSWDLVLMQIDTSGNIVGSVRNYGTPAADYAYRNHADFIRTSDGGFLLTGLTNSSSGFGSYDGLAVKVDSAFSLQWARVYGGASSDELIDVVEGSSGYFLAGRTASMGNGSSDVYLIKTDVNGVADNCRDKPITLTAGTLPYVRTAPPACP